MSEAAPAQDEVQVAPVQSPAPAAAAPRGRGLASLALVLAAASVGLAGWGVWQVRQLQGNEFNQGQHLEALNQRAEALRRFGRLDPSRTGFGAGLGLSLVGAVARLHGGTIELGDAAPGLRVRLSIPLG